MPHITWSDDALLDVVRLHDFLAPKSQEAAFRAVKTIQQGTQILKLHPEVGRLIDGLPPQIRELVIDFGQGAYIVRYLLEDSGVVILAVRHGREVGF